MTTAKARRSSRSPGADPVATGAAASPTTEGTAIVVTVADDVPPVAPTGRTGTARAMDWRQGAMTAAVLVALATGFGAGALSRQSALDLARADEADVRAALAAWEWKGAGQSVPQPMQDTLRRIGDDVRSARASLDLMRGNSDHGLTADDQKSLDRRFAATRDMLDRLQAEVSASLAQLSAKLDKVASETSGTASRVAALSARLDDIASEVERTRTVAAPVSTAVTPPGPVAAAAPGAAPQTPAVSEPATTGSLPRPGKTAPHGWSLRGVYNGVAIVEGPHGIYEVMQGDRLPELGRVEGIERRGRSWIVSTTRGPIQTGH